MNLKEAIKKLKPGTKVTVGAVEGFIGDPSKPGNLVDEKGAVLKYDPAAEVKEVKAKKVEKKVEKEVEAKEEPKAKRGRPAKKK